jgi:hypothetical protein
MTTTPEVIDLHPVPHPVATVRRAGFPLDHPYLEHCWTPLIGPSSVLLLRRCAWLWREAAPARIPTEELAGQLGLGKGTGRNSPVWHTVERIVRFRFAAMASPGELHVYTEVPPVAARQLERLPAWCRNEHERLLGQHLDGLARSAGQAAAPPGSPPPPHVRMAQRLDRLTTEAVHPPKLSR